MTARAGFIVVVGLFAGSLMHPSLVSAQVVPLEIQTAGNPSNAAAGESGGSVGSSALISVLAITPEGVGAPDLGASVGNGNSEIPLPAGWNLTSGFNLPPGGCNLSVTQFVNWGRGLYLIRVVPLLSQPACTWVSGDHHYVVRLSVTPNLITFTGRALGVLKIP